MGVTDPLPRSSMFFAGLILLIPHRIGMSRVNYVIKRYNLPISRAGLLLYKFHNPIEVSLTIGTFLGNATIWIAAGTEINKGYNKEGLKWILVGCCGLILILITLFDGFTNSFAFGCNASLYALGIPTSGALVSLLHNIYKFFSDSYHWDDFDYNVLRLQLLCNVITLLTTTILWIACREDLFGVNSAEIINLFNAANNKAHVYDWSPIGMLAISLGTVYAFYPSIAPYSIIDYQYASIIELWILLISSTPTLAFAILDLPIYGTSSDKGIGPGAGKHGNNKGPGYWNTTDPFNWNTNAGRLWHCIWFCAIPYILCIQIFMSMLHYPHSLLSSFFYKHPYRIGFISVLFNFLRETMQACGFAGAGKQNSQAPTGGNPQNIDGSIASTNKLITLFVMMFCVYTGDGYNKYQSFFYWLHPIKLY